MATLGLLSDPGPLARGIEALFPGLLDTREPVWSGAILPVSRYEDGSAAFDPNAGILGLLGDILTLPGRMAQVDPMSDPDAAIPMALEAAGLLGSAGFANLARSTPARAAGAADNLASNSVGIYDFPDMPPRPFFWDYPGVEFNVPGRRLEVDIEGRPLTAPVVAGRRVEGGGDEALSPEEYGAVTRGVTGAPPQILGERESQRLAGSLVPDFSPDGRYLGTSKLSVAGDLNADTLPRVLGHELAHAIDLNAFPPATRDEFFRGNFGMSSPREGVQDQLLRIYRDGNNEPGRPQSIMSPRARGYEQDREPEELWAEAVRAYMSNPNYVKSVGPDVAAAIRAAVNANPMLSKHIQFNVGGAPVPMGLLSTWTPEEVDEFRRRGGT